VGTIAVIPPELQAAAATLQRAGQELANPGGGKQRCTAAGDYGSPELERAVADVSASSLKVVFALWTAVGQAGANAAAASLAYTTTDSTVMPKGGH
jgi:hypothetical protein